VLDAVDVPANSENNYCQHCFYWKHGGGAAIPDGFLSDRLKDARVPFDFVAHLETAVKDQTEVLLRMQSSSRAISISILRRARFKLNTCKRFGQLLDTWHRDTVAFKIKFAEQTAAGEALQKAADEITLKKAEEAVLWGGELKSSKQMCGMRMLRIAVTYVLKGEIGRRVWNTVETWKVTSLREGRQQSELHLAAKVMIASHAAGLRSLLRSFNHLTRAEVSKRVAIWRTLFAEEKQGQALIRLVSDFRRGLSLRLLRQALVYMTRDGVGTLLSNWRFSLEDRNTTSFKMATLTMKQAALKAYVKQQARVGALRNVRMSLAHRTKGEVGTIIFIWFANVILWRQIKKELKADERVAEAEDKVTLARMKVVAVEERLQEALDLSASVLPSWTAGLTLLRQTMHRVLLRDRDELVQTWRQQVVIGKYTRDAIKQTMLDTRTALKGQMVSQMSKLRNHMVQEQRAVALNTSRWILMRMQQDDAGGLRLGGCVTAWHRMFLKDTLDHAIQEENVMRVKLRLKVTEADERVSRIEIEADERVAEAEEEVTSARMKVVAVEERLQEALAHIQDAASVAKEPVAENPAENLPAVEQAAAEAQTAEADPETDPALEAPKPMSTHEHMLFTLQTNVYQGCATNATTLNAAQILETLQTGIHQQCLAKPCQQQILASLQEESEMSD